MGFRKAEVAEMAKLVETTYRNVNIALANEFAIHAEELAIDVGSIIQAANSQPFSHIHNPGIAVGGHCIPVYPKFYLSTDSNASLPQVAITVNESMPQRAVEELNVHFKITLKRNGSLFLGPPYRGGVKEIMPSGALSLVNEITNIGWRPLVHDPLFSDNELKELGFEPFTLGSPCDAAITKPTTKCIMRSMPVTFRKLNTYTMGDALSRQAKLLRSL